MLQDGKLLALAVSTRDPMVNPIMVPTALSADIDYEYATWYGLLAPARTPASVLQLLNRAITEFGQDAELQAKILAQGIVPRNVGLGDFDAHIRREMDRLDPLLKSIGSQIGNRLRAPGAPRMIASRLRCACTTTCELSAFHRDEAHPSLRNRDFRRLQWRVEVSGALAQRHLRHTFNWDNLGPAVKGSCGRGCAYRAEGAITRKIAAPFH